MKLYKLSIEQKEEIQDKMYFDNCYFNPIEDINGDFFITQQEVDDCTNNNFLWIKELELNDYEPKQLNINSIT
jgi:hypothetical protein